MDYQVVLSLSARKNLRDIVRYISVDAPDRALDFGQLLVSRTKTLARFPELGRVVPEFNDKRARFNRGGSFLAWSQRSPRLERLMWVCGRNRLDTLSVDDLRIFGLIVPRCATGDQSPHTYCR
jgi:plasmid stabilization system protein ParE